MAALKIAFAFAVLSLLLFLASAIRPLSTGQPLESANGTVSTAHHLDVEGFRHVDLSLRRPFRHHGGAHFFGFRIHLGVDGFHHPHHHRHHDGGHGFHGVVVEHEREFKKGYDPAEPSEAGVRRKMEAEDEENEVKEWNPSFFHRHSHHFGGHRFRGGWVAKHEELRKIKKMVKKTKEDSDSDSDADSDAEAEDNDEGKEKGGWLGWFKSIWSHVHRRRCHHHHHHLRLHREHHYLGHRSHRFHGWKVNPEGDETTPRTWLAAHWEDSERHRHLEREEDVKEIMEQPELISEEIRSKDSETGAGEPETEE